MSLETIISTARNRVLSRVTAILDDGRSHALAVRRELIVRTAVQMGDIENTVAAAIKAAKAAQEERPGCEKPYYEVVEEVLGDALREIGRRNLALAEAREAALKAALNARREGGVA